MAEPYYSDDAVTIYHGDFREEYFRGGPAGAVVTDPPYGTSYYPTDTDVLTGEVLTMWLDYFSSVAVFGWPERLVGLCMDADGRPVPDEWVTWWPSNPRGGRGFNRVGLLREVEAIAVFGAADWGSLRQPRTITTTPMPNAGLRGVPQTDQARMGDVWRDESPNLNPNQPARLHPNEKPVSLMARLLRALPAETVFDPFMGSGTTLRAAKDLGRKAIGVEIEERYCEIAAKRMGQEVFDFGEAA